MTVLGDDVARFVVDYEGCSLPVGEVTSIAECFFLRPVEGDVLGGTSEDYPPLRMIRYYVNLRHRALLTTKWPAPGPATKTAQ
jgi:hypothetical protein